MPVPGLLASLPVFDVSVLVLGLFTLPFMFSVFVPMPRWSAFLFMSGLSVPIPELFAPLSPFAVPVPRPGLSSLLFSTWSFSQISTPVPRR